MGKSQREKGKRGERELAMKLREYGYDCRRGQQYCGANGDADVLGLPGIHIECKRVRQRGNSRPCFIGVIGPNGWLRCGWRTGRNYSGNGILGTSCRKRGRWMPT